MARTRVLLIHNRPVLASDHPEAASEAEILETAETALAHLRDAGFAVDKLAIGRDPLPFLRFIRRRRPEAVFNLFEGTGEDGGSWKENIVATTFWIGEPTSSGNPSNTSSAWDSGWMAHYGGEDSPTQRVDFLPNRFIPRQNPFYIALPYSDVSHGHTKPEAAQIIPWFKSSFSQSGRSILKDRWVAIRRGARVCYAQWEDAGPFRTDHWQYVFGNERPLSNQNHDAGIDLSPAVRDFLNIGGMDSVDWKFVEFSDVPTGPWTRFGDNNPFVQQTRNSTTMVVRRDD